MRIYNQVVRVFIWLLLFIPEFVEGQISQGGTPVQVQKLKSFKVDDLIILPHVDNSELQKESIIERGKTQLKPLHFAYPFDVSYNLNNSGQWFTDGDIKVWQLRIRSVGAYSLNVIFGRFNLPENARLFLIGAATGVVKGAYTSANNSASQILAVEPLAGDELLIQYEEPKNVTFPGQIEISRVSHDFLGVVTNDHRPLGLSGPCNENVNCDVANGSEELKDAVCRIFVAGTELCTATLMNNTALDGKPYMLTAYHCLAEKTTNAISEKFAQSTVFLFNYESPSCSTIDGDVSRSLSGSTIKASFDSLDFVLVQTNNQVPYNYRPFFSGWNRNNVAPSSSLSIHHPLGDIKKVSIDKDNAITARFNNTYLAKGFWEILQWDVGVTEAGSSGGPLFDQNKLFIGTLTGGSATCSSPVKDYFEKFALAWDYKSDIKKQLKYWLDPVASNVTTLNSMTFNSGTTLCKPITNIKNNDSFSAVQIVNGITKKGYYSGTNTAGFTDFAERYSFAKNCEIQGITLGIAVAKTNPSFVQSFINIQVFDGTDKPKSLLYSEKFDIKKFYPGAMNYLPFANSVKTTGNFFISYNISELHDGDTLAVYMANRKADLSNSFFLKNQTGWMEYNSQNLSGNGSALVTELIACNIDTTSGLEPGGNKMVYASFYPNPLNGNSVLTVLTVNPIDCPENTVVYDLLGKKQNVLFNQNGPNKLLLNFSGKLPGIYFVHIEAGGRQIVGKIAYMP